MNDWDEMWRKPFQETNPDYDYMRTERTVTDDMARLIKGMLARGDDQSDIAACFRINGGRVSEINTGKRFPEIRPAPVEELPPVLKSSSYELWLTGKKVNFNNNNKFDIQLGQALVNERKLAHIFTFAKIEKVELKSESHLWERTGNIAIEYMANGKPSGIAATEADIWVHELKRNGETLLYLMFPTDRLKQIAREAYARGDYREGGGDGGRFAMVLLRLSDLLK